MPTPSWQAARSGLPGDTNAVDKSAQINQFLGTHGVTPIYQGSQVVTPVGQGAGGASLANYWIFHLDTFDYDQPFAMSGSVLGRVTLPVFPVGNGADLLVSLCVDSSGSPGTVVASTLVPAKWIANLSAVVGAPGTSAASPVPEASSSPLCTSLFNTAQIGSVASTPWNSPAVDAAGGGANSFNVQSGSYLITLGGSNSGGSATTFVWTTPWLGGNQLGEAVPQPPLPVATSQPGAVTTADNIVVVGGLVAGTGTANVFVAGWSPETGSISSWTTQAPLPQTVAFSGIASSGSTVYSVGGLGVSGPIRNVYYATIQNGQISGWSSGQPFPTPIQSPAVAILSGFLVVCGGSTTSANSGATNAVFYAPILPNGSLGSWQTGPSMPVALLTFQSNAPVVGSTIVIWGGTLSSGFGDTHVQALPVTSSGPGQWRLQNPGVASGLPTAAFKVDDGSASIFGVSQAAYYSSTVRIVPTISVPLPASGLSNGATYHILVQQKGGDVNNYMRIPVDFNCLTGNPTALFRPKGTTPWSAYFSGFAIPIAAYNQAPGGLPLHTWEDGGARVTTVVNASTPDQRLLGIADATQFADGTMDASVCAINYPGTWPAGAWPPLTVAQL